MGSEVLELDPLEALSHIPHPLVVVTVGDPDNTEKRNGMTAAWISRVSWDPPLVAVAIAPTRYTHELISTFREFALNIVSERLLDVALKVFGSVSGREQDKFKLAGIEPGKAKKIRAPIIREAPIVIECKLVSAIRTGDHTVFIGKVVAAYRNNEDKPLVWLLSEPHRIE